MTNKIELLAPAGSREALHAAVENGADAVYLGGKLFNARQQADNFDTDVLKEALDYAHARGVNIYLTMNTLVSDSEMKPALQFAAEAGEAGIDGLIVQDLGLARLLRELLPDVPLHGSTQMTIYDMDGVRALEALGFKRVVLARELTLQEASEIARNTKLEVEIFVHGALCVCYSGQCLMSSIIGGRSGNRGRCAQPCRLPYKLLKVSGAGRIIKSKEQYLLSPKDMCSLEYIDEIIDSGIHSLKIEGRMKSPEYVATVVRIYRKYLDDALAQRKDEKISKVEIEDTDIHDLLQVYNRGGFSAGYLKGKTGLDMMSFNKPNNSGIYLGRAEAYDQRLQTVTLRLEDTLSIGDGVEIWAGGFNSPGGIVTSISKGDIPQRKRNTGNSAEVCPLSLYGDIPQRKRNTKSLIKGSNPETAGKGELVAIGSFRGYIEPGMGVYKTMDAGLNKAARESYSGRPLRKVPITGQAVLKTGQPLILNVSDTDGHTAEARGTALPEPTLNKPLTVQRLKEQLSKTGATPMIFTKLEIELEEGISIPVSEINEVRRKAMDSLLAKRMERYKERSEQYFINERIDEVLDKSGAFTATGNSCAEKRSIDGKSAAISLYFYRWNETIDYLKLGADRLYLPLSALDKPGFKERARNLHEAGVEVFTWLPSITRGNYNKLTDKLENEINQACQRRSKFCIDGILAGNIGTINKFDRVKSYMESCPDTGELKLAGDISLNLYNSFSIQEAASIGLDSITVSVEMTMQQIKEITAAKSRTVVESDLSHIEAVVYGRLPLMMSEYCPVGCTEGGLKSGSTCINCCAKSEYKLEDRMGKEFPVLCDRIACRSTILNSNVLFIPESLPSLKAAGVGLFRLYIWDENQENIRNLVQMHKAAAAGKLKYTGEYSRLVEQIKKEGYTKGHYFRGV